MLRIRWSASCVEKSSPTDLTISASTTSPRWTYNLQSSHQKISRSKTPTFPHRLQCKFFAEGFGLRAKSKRDLKARLCVAIDRAIVVFIVVADAPLCYDHVLAEIMLKVSK